jgi:hypothetical protein
VWLFVPEPRTPRRLQASAIALVSFSTMTIKHESNLATGQCNFVVLANVIDIDLFLHKYGSNIRRVLFFFFQILFLIKEG